MSGGVEVMEIGEFLVRQADRAVVGPHTVHTCWSGAVRRKSTRKKAKK